MKNYLTKLSLLVALGAGVALAQAYPQQQEQKPSEPTSPQTQQQPAPEQTQPQAQPQEKMPQGEAAPNTTDVQSNIQAAIQKEPTLASSNIQVNVTNKEVELSGTVGSASDKKTAEQIAKSNAGGRKVKSHLKVSSAAPGAPPK